MKRVGQGSLARSLAVAAMTIWLSALPVRMFQPRVFRLALIDCWRRYRPKAAPMSPLISARKLELGTAVHCAKPKAVAAVAWSLLRKESTDAFWLPSDDSGGRRNGLRSMDLVEDREVHPRGEHRDGKREVGKLPYQVDRPRHNSGMTE